MAIAIAAMASCTAVDGDHLTSEAGSTHHLSHRPEGC